MNWKIKKLLQSVTKPKIWTKPKFFSDTKYFRYITYYPILEMSHSDTKSLWFHDLALFVRLFSNVRYQMCPQITCIKGCKHTLVAFVWLFSNVGFYMRPWSVCLRGCIVADSHWLHLFNFSPLWVFKCPLKLPLRKEVIYSHWLHLWEILSRLR